MQDSSPSRSRTIRPPQPSPSPSVQQPDGATSPNITKSNEIWFEDGNLILASNNVYFRVYKGILALHSPVFQDMVNFPQPRNVDEFEGCPVVRIYDEPADVMHFLKALHDVSYFDLFMAESIKWTCFSAVLRLSTKYQVDFLRHRAYKLLSSLYPTTLAKWDARDSTTSLESFEARPFAVYLLAKEADLPSVLPAALYLCADSQDINYILEGLESHDAKHIQLEWQDKKACIRAREALSIALRTQDVRLSHRPDSLPGVSKHFDV
ncbi:hypothetical protein AAF712_009113 [Marasmius tenuissimus]|uniref:BTB domain-containing protein n=1 Tax=Marasmius tenuissimus TaxID=585030 RepID=A0ABR2ZR99_9AGAR